MQENTGKVRFIRVHGRVVPVRSKGGDNIKPVGIAARLRKVSAGERFKQGAKVGSVIGAIGGGAATAALVAMAGAGGKNALVQGAVGAVRGGIGWGLLGGAGNALFGRREQVQFGIVGEKIIRKKRG